MEGFAKHIFVLKGGMGKKQRRTTAEALVVVPETESRVIIAPVATLVKALMTPGSTLFFSQCRFLGRARFSNT